MSEKYIKNLDQRVLVDLIIFKNELIKSLKTENDDEEAIKGYIIEVDKMISQKIIAITWDIKIEQERFIEDFGLSYLYINKN